VTQVFFYHNAANRIGATAALIGKACAQKKALLVYAPDADIAAALDRQLWAQAPTSFVPHVAADSPLAAETPVLIASSLDVLPHDERLFNLSNDVPPGFSRFASLIEIVGQGEEERADGRQRARFYKDRGYAVRYVDLLRKKLMANDEDLLSRANSLINADNGAGRGGRPSSPRPMRRRRSFLASPDSDSFRRRPALSLREQRRRRPAAIDRRRRDRRNPSPSRASMISLRTCARDPCHRACATHRPPSAAALPALVEAAAAEAAEHLRQGIEATIAMAARDFVAQRGQLQLPLEEPAGQRSWRSRSGVARTGSASRPGASARSAIMRAPEIHPHPPPWNSPRALNRLISSVAGTPNGKPEATSAPASIPTKNPRRFLHPAAATQRHRHPAHGARLQPGDHGRAHPLPSHAR
jgi:DNA polymerase-3 subunit chi